MYPPSFRKAAGCSRYVITHEPEHRENWSKDEREQYFGTKFKHLENWLNFLRNSQTTDNQITSTINTFHSAEFDILALQDDGARIIVGECKDKWEVRFNEVGRLISLSKMIVPYRIGTLAGLVGPRINLSKASGIPNFLATSI